MCDCIEKAKERIAKLGDDVKIDGVSFYVGKDKNFHDFMSGKCRYTLDNGKRKSMPLIFKYCPFCGKQIKEEEEL